MGTREAPQGESSGGCWLCQWLVSFDTPKTIHINHAASGTAVHLLQFAIFVIILAANFSTPPWRSDGDAQYFFSAVSKLPAIEASSSPPKVSFPSSDTWRIKVVAGPAVEGGAWDVAELQFWTPPGVVNDSRPIAISSGTVSDAAYGSVTGYEADKAFDQNSASIWGGRKDADGQLWIGLQYSKPVQVTAIKMMQGMEPISSHVGTKIAIEAKHDGVWERVDEVVLLARGGVFEDVFKFEDEDDLLVQPLVWASEVTNQSSVFPPSLHNCSLPGCKSQYYGGAPAWTAEQIVPAAGHASLFIPLRSVDQIEVFRTCRGPLPHSSSLPRCSTDDDCRKSTSDAMSLCGGDGVCLVRRWCPLAGRSVDNDLRDKLVDAQYEVIARLKPVGKSKIYSNYKSASLGQEEICISCRFDPVAQLSFFRTLQMPEDFMSNGLEIEHTFHWQCPGGEEDDRYSCNVWTDQAITRDRSSLSIVTFPVARGTEGEMLRRRVTFYGMNIHFKGEGYAQTYTVYPMLNFICQVFGLLFLAGSLGTSLSYMIAGGERRCSFAREAYAENLHASLRKVVKIKKSANADLQGLTDHRVHQRVKEDVEILTGVDFNKPQNCSRVKTCIDALMKHKGSPLGAAKALGTDCASPENLRSLAESLRMGRVAREGAAESLDTGSTSIETHSMSSV